MEIDLRQSLEAVLLSTAEPILLRDLVKLYARFEAEREVTDSADGATEAADSADGEAPAPADAAATDGPPRATRYSKAAIREGLEALTRAAEAEDKAYRIVEGPNGFQLVTAPQYAELIRLLRGEPRPMKLSPAALETMSIVAYRQPVTRAEMEAIRGVSVDSALNKLIELELVHVMGRAELPGRPIQYGTTDRFLEFAGIRDLDELPASDVLSNHQIDEWMRRSETPETTVSDQDVGLPKERDPGELPLDEQFVEMDWKRENTESDAASNRPGDSAASDSGEDRRDG